jgi:hypothetical protein
MIGMLRLLRVVVAAALIIAAAPVALVAGAGAVIRVVGHPARQIASIPYPSDALPSGSGRHHGHRQDHTGTSNQQHALQSQFTPGVTVSAGCSPFRLLGVCTPPIAAMSRMPLAAKLPTP